MNAIVESLLTAEEFALRPIADHREELVQGRIVAMSPPGFDHSEVQFILPQVLGPLLRTIGQGRLVGELGVVLVRNPDTVRAPDAAYYSYARVPAGTSIQNFPNVLPEVVFEVRSPSDTWPEVLDKVAEYLAVGIVAIVLDPRPRRVHIFEPGQAERRLGSGDVFDLPSLWPNLNCAVADFFV